MEGFWFVIVAFCLQISLAITPTGEISVRQSSDYIYAAPGSFGTDLPSESETIYRKLTTPLGDNLDGCDPIVSRLSKTVQYYILVSRGNCSFVDKARAAEEAGAKGVIIYNSLEGIYKGQSYADEVDYECDNGMGYVDELVYPLYGSEMDAKMPTSCTSNSLCDSGRCVVTNTTDENGIKVCCAWDLYQTMSAEEDDDSVSIPTVFITMSDSDVLLSNPELGLGTLEVSMYSRPDYAVDLASLSLWIMAIITVTAGASQAAEDDKNRSSSFKRGQRSQSDTESSYEPSDSENATESTPLNPNATSSPSYLTSSDAIAAKQGRQKPINQPEEPLVISTWYAVGFIVISSAFLILLYYVNLYSTVIIVYLIAAVFACTLVYFNPFFSSVYSKCYFFHTGNRWKQTVDSWVDVPFMFAFFISLIIAGSWYFESESSWSWIPQDIMGIAVCILFLKYIQVPNLKVATILLLLAFFYDIFFVFISSYFFESSVMIQVATGSTSDFTTDDENYCEKYPDTDECQSTSLPMLLIMPTFSSYLSSDSMLGLGDIVIPGLLLSWTARYDMRRYGTLSSEQASKGYFPMAVFGYACGLMIADIAVSYYDSGQPALLYIVPCTLGSVLYRSYKSETIGDLWERLPPMKTIAIPLNRDEQEVLISRSDVVETVATWTLKGNSPVVVLDRIHSAELDNTPMSMPSSSRSPPVSPLTSSIRETASRAAAATDFIPDDN